MKRFASFARRLLLTVAGLGATALHASFPAGANQFAGAAVIPSASIKDQSLPTDLSSFTSESGEPLPTEGLHTAWWRWTAPADGWVTFDTLSFGALGGSVLSDSYLAVYTGASLGTLVTVKSNDNAAPGNPLSSLTFYARTGTTYRIQLDSGAFGLYGKATLSMRFFQPQALRIQGSGNAGNPVHLVATTTATGAVSAKLTVAGRTRPLKGVATIGGYFQATLPQPLFVNGLPVVPLVLTLDLLPTGSGGHSVWIEGVAEQPVLFQAFQAQPFHESAHSIAPVLTAALKSLAAEVGHGFMTARVAASGRVTLAGRLGDGSALLSSSMLCRYNPGAYLVPFGPGSPRVTGTMLCTEVAGDSDTLGDYSTGSYVRPASAKSPLYAGGLQMAFNVKGGAYTPPPAGQRALGFLNATAGAGKLGLTTVPGEYTGFVESLQFSTANAFTFLSPTRRPALKLQPKTGLVSGSIEIEPGKPRKILAILANDGGTPRIHGWVMGVARTGKVTVLP